MSQYYVSPTRPDTAAGAIATHLRVKTSGALVVAGATDLELGTMDSECTAAGPATVRLRTAQGTSKMIANGAITANASVYAAASGKVSGSGTQLIGTALEAATTDGDVIEVIRTPPAVNDLTEIVTATNILTAAESGKLCFLNSATEFVSTLPAPAAGLTFKFVVTAAPAGASYTIVTASSANIIKGHVLSSEDAGGSGDSETSGGDTITFVDGQSVAGDMVELVCDGTNWFASCKCKVVAGITITTAS